MIALVCAQRRVIPEHQEVVRERRGVETLVALLETLRGTLEKRLSQAIEHLGIKVVSLCLKTLSLLISRSHQCCVSAALHLPLLMKFVVVEYLPKPATADVDKHLEPCSRDLARLAAALLQVTYFSAL